MRFFHCALNNVRKDPRLVGIRELVSYWELRQKKDPAKAIQDLLAIRSEVLIDSGAYSAYRQKQVIPHDEFLTWHSKVPRNPRLMAAALDDLQDPRRSSQNFLQSREYGLFPTYHQGEPLEGLLEYLKISLVVGLGGLVRDCKVKARPEQNDEHPWLEECFLQAPGERFHLFGVSDIRTVRRFPTASSADSSTAGMAAVFGCIMYPPRNPLTGKIDPNKNLIRIGMSAKSNYNRLQDLKPGVRAVVLSYLEAEGFLASKLETKAYERQVFNILQMEKQLKTCSPLPTASSGEFNLFE
jgi:hypothetical protein